MIVVLYIFCFAYRIISK